MVFWSFAKISLTAYAYRQTLLSFFELQALVLRAFPASQPMTGLSDFEMTCLCWCPDVCNAQCTHYTNSEQWQHHTSVRQKTFLFNFNTFSFLCVQKGLLSHKNSCLTGLCPGPRWRAYSAPQTVPWSHSLGLRVSGFGHLGLRRFAPDDLISDISDLEITWQTILTILANNTIT